MAPEVETFAQSIGHYEEHEVVLHEERPVVEKDVLPKERVRLATDTVTDEQQVSEQLRKDRIETEGDIGIGRGRMTEVRLGGSATVSSEPAGALPGGLSPKRAGGVVIRERALSGRRSPW